MVKNIWNINCWIEQEHRVCDIFGMWCWNGSMWIETPQRSVIPHSYLCLMQRSFWNALSENEKLLDCHNKRKHYLVTLRPRRDTVISQNPTLALPSLATFKDEPGLLKAGMKIDGNLHVWDWYQYFLSILFGELSSFTFFFLISFTWFSSA